MVQPITNTNISNITINAQNTLYTYKGRPINPIDSSILFLNHLSKSELNDYVDSFYRKSFSEKLINRESAFKLNSFLLRMKSEYETSSSIYDIKSYKEILRIMGVTEGNFSYDEKETLSKIGMNYDNYFSHTSIKNIANKYNDNEKISINNYYNTNNTNNTSSGLGVRGGSSIYRPSVSMDDPRERFSLNSSKESFNKSKNKDKEGINYCYSDRRKQRQKYIFPMERSGIVYSQRKVSKQREQPINSSGTISVEDYIDSVVEEECRKLVWEGRNKCHDRPHIQWPSMHPRLPFKLRYLDEEEEIEDEVLGRDNEVLARDEEVLGRDNVTKKIYVKGLGKNKKPLGKLCGSFACNNRAYIKQLINKKSQKNEISKAKLFDKVIHKKTKESKRLGECRKSNKRENIYVDKSGNPQVSLNTQRGYREKGHNFLMVCAGNNAGVVGIVPYGDRRADNRNKELLNQAVLRSAMLIAKRSPDINQDINLDISQYLLDWCEEDRTETYIWPSGHPLILSKIRRIESFPLSPENDGGAYHRRLHTFFRSDVAWPPPPPSGPRGMFGTHPGTTILRPEPLAGAGFESLAGTYVYCRSCRIIHDVEDFSDDDEDYCLNQHRADCKMRKHIFNRTIDDSDDSDD